MHVARTFSRHSLFLPITVLIFILNYADRRLLSVLAIPVKADLHLSDAQLGFLLGPAFVFFYAFMGIPLGRLADVMNRKLLLCICVAGWSLMTGLTGLASTFVLLAIARFGIGIGEAAMQPSVYSMIADLYPVERRATASAIFALGLPLGSMIAFFGAGWLERTFGWREAFWTMGVIGLSIALLAYIFLSEPQRMGAQDTEIEERPPSFFSVLGHLWAIRSFRFSVLGVGFSAMTYDAAAQWSPSFLDRSYGMTIAEVGSWMGPAIGIGGCIGTFLGGYLCDVLKQRDLRWSFWLPALALSLVVIPDFLAYWTDQKLLTLITLAFPLVLCPMHSAPFASTLQSMATPRTRGLALASGLLIASLIGFGIGTQLIGFISDALQPRHGPESLRHALLLIGPAAALISAACFYRASLTVRDDLSQ